MTRTCLYLAFVLLGYNLVMRENYCWYFNRVISPIDFVGMFIHEKLVRGLSRCLRSHFLGVFSSISYWRRAFSLVFWLKGQEICEWPMIWKTWLDLNSLEIGVVKDKILFHPILKIPSSNLLISHFCFISCLSPKIKALQINFPQYQHN